MKVRLIFCCITFARILSADEPFPSGKFAETSNSASEISKFVNLGLGLGLGSKEVEANGEDIPGESLGRRDRFLDREVADQLEGNGWLDVIPGTPGKDYPNYQIIPQTSFTCDEKTNGGYYADIEARCQVFHVCDTEGKKSSFMCPSGSIFNQKYLVCDWWYDFECDDATELYSLNEKVNRGGTGSGPGGPGLTLIENEGSDARVSGEGNFGYDLSLAGTGEGSTGYGKPVDGYRSNVRRKEPDDEGRDETTRGENRETSSSSEGEQRRRGSESVNWGRKRYRKPGNFAGDEGKEGREDFRGRNEHPRQNRESGRSTGLGKELLHPRRGVDDEGNNAGGDNRSSEYRRTSITSGIDEAGEAIVRRVHSGVEEERNAFRVNNYSTGDYLLGVVTEDRKEEDEEDDRGNRSPPRSSINGRRFLPIL